MATSLSFIELKKRNAQLCFRQQFSVTANERHRLSTSLSIINQRVFDKCDHEITEYTWQSNLNMSHSCCSTKEGEMKYLRGDETLSDSRNAPVISPLSTLLLVHHYEAVCPP